MFKYLFALTAILAVQAFIENEKIPIYVNDVSAFDNPSEMYNYYDFPFCKPTHVEEETQSLGEDLSGERKSNSLYEIHFLSKNYLTKKAKLEK